MNLSKNLQQNDNQEFIIDQMNQEQSAIILGYHYPCLDGAYSLLVAFLYLKSLFSIFENASVQDIIDLIFQENPKAYEVQTLQQQVSIESNQGYFYPNLNRKIFYLSLCHTTNEHYIQDQMNQFNNKCDFDKSILILLDYYGQSYENLKILSKKFKKIIIVDHHITCLEMFKNKDPIENLRIYFNQKKSGVTLALDFFNKVENYNFHLNFSDHLKFDNIVSQEIQRQIFLIYFQNFNQLFSRLKELSLYIEDNDIKANQIKDVGPFIAYVYSLKLQLSATQNGLLFYQLMHINIPVAIHLGQSIMQEHEKRVNSHLPKKKKFIFKSKDFKVTGYGIFLEDSQMVNSLGEKLAHMSLKDGFDNMGILIIKQQKNKYKVSLRGLNSSDQQVCAILASIYKGGGHPNAASFFITQQQLNQIIKNV